MLRSIATTVLAIATMSLPALAEEATVTGCVMPGVEANCLIIKTATETYDVTSATPEPKPGQFGTVTGTLFDGASVCQQGRILKPAHWEPAPAKACPSQ
ncbi:MAG: hypothetical protein HY245_08785 [Rhizobiales bacterium]|nr:hypothetical protein [Hyphomicrobiales bacterium]MBI3673499.1 hypothetical protein [Hyphomicrobiales bacterium]